jgi:hypothetical protein
VEGRLRFPQKRGMCYNRRAVKDTGKQDLAPTEESGQAGVESAIGEAEGTSARGLEDASRCCPVCSQRLESRRCKLICSVCGYYMSCADYY